MKFHGATQEVYRKLVQEKNPFAKDFQEISRNVRVELIKNADKIFDAVFSV